MPALHEEVANLAGIYTGLLCNSHILPRRIFHSYSALLCAILRNNYRHAVLEELALAIGREADAECRKSLQCSYFLLKEGHVVERSESGAAYISVAGPHSIVSQQFSAQDVREKGIDLLVEELKTAARF